VTVYPREEAPVGSEPILAGPVARVMVAMAAPARLAAACLSIDTADSIAVCAQATDSASAVAAAVRTLPSVCVVDLELPGGAIAAIWEIIARLPTTKVIALTSSEHDRDFLAALSAGAHGCLVSGPDGAELVAAVRNVGEGDPVLSTVLVARLMAEFRDRGARRRVPISRSATSHRAASPLTSREWQVLELMRHDYSTTEMASRLVVSNATIRTHVAAVLHKLDLPNREAVASWLARDKGVETSQHSR
jgi:DNA-binding NarL/FixJ family response regulator